MLYSVRLGAAVSQTPRPAAAAPPVLRSPPGPRNPEHEKHQPTTTSRPKRPRSEAQIATSRGNGSKSPGPKTPDPRRQYHLPHERPQTRSQWRVRPSRRRISFRLPRTPECLHRQLPPLGRRPVLRRRTARQIRLGTWPAPPPTSAPTPATVPSVASAPPGTRVVPAFAPCS